MSADGMDMIDLFIGSEGIYGIITEADLWLVPRRPYRAITAFFPDDGSAVAAVKEMRGSLDTEYIEFMDGRSAELVRKVSDTDPTLIRAPRIPDDAGAVLFLDLPEEGFAEQCSVLIGILERHGSSADRCWCGHESVDLARMREIRHSVPRSVNAYIAMMKRTFPDIHKMGSDMSVPDGKADEMMSFYRTRLAEEGLDHVMFGHIADNHVHVNILLRSMEDFEKGKELNSEFAAKAAELGGSPSAEHGIGKIKVPYIGLMYGEAGAADIRRIKDVLDPNGILNAGNITGGFE